MFTFSRKDHYPGMGKEAVSGNNVPAEEQTPNDMGWAQSHTESFVRGLDEGQAVVSDLMMEFDYDIREVANGERGSRIGNRLHEYEMGRMAITGSLVTFNSNEEKAAFEAGKWAGVNESVNRAWDQWNNPGGHNE